MNKFYYNLIHHTELTEEDLQYVPKDRLQRTFDDFQYNRDFWAKCDILYFLRTVSSVYKYAATLPEEEREKYIADYEFLQTMQDFGLDSLNVRGLLHYAILFNKFEHFIYTHQIDESEIDVTDMELEDPDYIVDMGYFQLNLKHRDLVIGLINTICDVEEFRDCSIYKYVNWATYLNYISCEVPIMLSFYILANNIDALSPEQGNYIDWDYKQREVTTLLSCYIFPSTISKCTKVLPALYNEYPAYKKKILGRAKQQDFPFSWPKVLKLRGTYDCTDGGFDDALLCLSNLDIDKLHFQTLSSSAKFARHVLALRYLQQDYKPTVQENKITIYSRLVLASWYAGKVFTGKYYSISSLLLGFVVPYKNVRWYRPTVRAIDNSDFVIISMSGTSVKVKSHSFLIVDDWVFDSVRFYYMGTIKEYFEQVFKNTSYLRLSVDPHFTVGNYIPEEFPIKNIQSASAKTYEALDTYTSTERVMKSYVT